MFHFKIYLIGVDGMWSDWGKWSACSKTCDAGKKQRSRTCTNPKPKHPGRDCDGRNQERDGCNRHTCPVHGKSSSDTAYEIE